MFAETFSIYHLLEKPRPPVGDCQGSWGGSHLHVQGDQDRQQEQKDAGPAPPRGPEAPADAGMEIF